MKALTALLLVCLLPACQVGGPPDDLRVLSYNIHYWVPVLPTPAGKAEFERARAGRSVVQLFAAELSKLDLDVISLQEARDPERVAALAKELGMHHVFFPGGWKGKGWPRGIPGAILTRHEILASDDCPLVHHEKRPEAIFTRHLGRVLIRVGGEEVALFTTHLLPSWKNTAHIRLAEIEELAALVRREREAGRSAIVMGDFNLAPDSEEYAALRRTGWVDTFVAKGAGNPLTCPTDQPKERIDYVFAAGRIAARLRASRALHEGRFVVSDESAFALSDHVPVLSVFR